MEESHAKAVIRGRRSKAEGARFEDIIGYSCRYFSERGIAEIEKTPEPVKQISGKDRKGHFMAVHEKKAQPDYKGTVRGGKSVVFEAKHTDSDRLLQSAVTDEQAARLDSHARLGAECFILVSFEFRQFYKIPWEEFRNMKEKFGRKYVKREDVESYRIRFEGGILYFI